MTISTGVQVKSVGFEVSTAVMIKYSVLCDVYRRIR
jgi:hypothetical protein